MTITPEEPRDPLLNKLLSVVMSVSDDAVDSLLRRAVTQHPERTPSQVLDSLDTMYLAAVTTSGAAVGGTAALPVVGTGASVALSAAELVANLEATLVLALAYSRVHGVHVQDVERRTTLLLGILAGDSTSGFIGTVSGRVGKHWGKEITKSTSLTTISKINAVLGRNFVTKYGTKQGVLVIGRAIPFGIGALIGAGANAALGYAAIKSIQRAFGPAPEQMPARLFGTDVDL